WPRSTCSSCRLSDPRASPKSWCRRWRWRSQSSQPAWEASRKWSSTAKPEPSYRQGTRCRSRRRSLRCWPIPSAFAALATQAGYASGRRIRWCGSCPARYLSTKISSVPPEIESDTASPLDRGDHDGATPCAHVACEDEAPMSSRIVNFALHQRFITLALVLLLVALGIVAFLRLPIEAYPDVADVEVDVITLWPGHAAEEVERHITIALEKELNGVPRVTFLRSISIFGLSNIRVIFDDGTDDYWARRQVLERVGQADLPNDVKPQLAPLASF